MVWLATAPAAAAIGAGGGGAAQAELFHGFLYRSDLRRAKFPGIRLSSSSGTVPRNEGGQPVLWKYLASDKEKRI